MDPIPNAFNPYKHLKEEFVSNLTGSSMLEIAGLSTSVPLLFLLRHSRYSNRSAVLGSKNLGAYVAAVTMDFLFIVLPTLLLLTVLADWVYVFTILLMVLVFFMTANRSIPSASYSGGSISLRENISSYRVLVTIVTCLCILAVDFRIFPRRYAKTETYGTSLMDLGVGCFTLANALVSQQARGVSSVNWKTTIRSTSPLLLLGFSRLLSTRSVDYQVHSGEYGVHWNFFFTLAAVSILSSIVNIRPQYSGIVGLIVLVGYQSWLSHGFNIYLLSDQRGSDIISQNKEGIFSIFGYWGMYLIGVWLGNYLFFGNHPSTTLRSNNWARIRVFLLALIFWLVTIGLDRHVERVSRRTCNLAYVTLVLAENFQILAILMLSDCITGSKISAFEESFNQNLLGAFLVANLLTGLINLFVDTLFTPSPVALFILALYAYVLSILPGIAHCCGVRLKFW